MPSTLDLSRLPQHDSSRRPAAAPSHDEVLTRFNALPRGPLKMRLGAYVTGNLMRYDHRRTDAVRIMDGITSGQIREVAEVEAVIRGHG